ncbi:DUF6482 family protein [Halomonas saccharevitans]|uniref:Uncharacterized protein n=1 Tax=Halomonas saccharevitans TaxID=416872 RepID=A0A1I7CS28_9GAMM|nr:DUF6482 family protein [Halomonas saccharevitans]SFU02225.1 hypothetical protein SAMN04487956_1595 [Halomonas saccharevitans]
MSASPAPLPERVTLEALGDWLRAGRVSTIDVPAIDVPGVDMLTVEVQSIDQGYYLVRLHHAQGVSQLVGADGQAKRFTGTQWVSRALLPLGITHGVLTWAEVTDEMIGLPATQSDPQSVLAYGTRVAFQTR